MLGKHVQSRRDPPSTEQPGLALQRSGWVLTESGSGATRFPLYKPSGCGGRRGRPGLRLERLRRALT